MTIAALDTGLPTLWLVLLALSTVALWYRTPVMGWWRRLREIRRRVLTEDALKHVHNCKLRGDPATSESLASGLGTNARSTAELVTRLEGQGLLRSSAEGFSLTSEGTRLALHVIRAHRLWERYLADEARMPLADVHAEAERREHSQTAEQLDALEAAMGHPATDPHGDPIPSAAGELKELRAQAITDWPTRTPGRIVHLEDEPPAVFAQIAALGFHPGQIIWVVEADTRRIVLSDGDETHTLAPVVGANIFVRSVEAEVEDQPRHRPRLTTLERGQKATIHGLADELHGFTRRRLLDLGLTPGATIAAEMSSIFNEPVAYRVRGSLIALRRDQAEHVVIEMGGGKKN